MLEYSVHIKCSVIFRSACWDDESEFGLCSQSEKVQDSLYSSNWQDKSKRYKSCLRLMMLCSHRPLCLRGIIFTVNMGHFVDVSKNFHCSNTLSTCMCMLSGREKQSQAKYKIEVVFQSIKAYML